jgi:hypothetical protein
MAAADMFPDEGLDLLLAIVPKNGTNWTNTYVGLFTSAAGGSAVPAANATIASMGTNYAECLVAGWSTYVRQTHAATGWGAVGAKTIAGTVGRGCDGTQVSFPAPTGAYSPTNPICGFFLSDLSTNGKSIFYANFSDTTPISALAIGDIVKVTPTFGYGN